MNGYRFYIDKDLDFLIEEEKDFHHPTWVRRAAMNRLRMYASLYARNLRKSGFVNENSECSACKSKINLQIDHIIPISKGGRNEINNIQILCRTCNIQKSNKII